MAQQKKPVNKTIRVQVKRAFTWDESVLKIGSVLDLPENFGLSAIACNKAVRVPEVTDAEKPAEVIPPAAPAKATTHVKTGGK